MSLAVVNTMLVINNYTIKNIHLENGLVFLYISELNGSHVRIVLDEVDIDSKNPSYSTADGCTDIVYSEFIRNNWNKIVTYVRRYTMS